MQGWIVRTNDLKESKLRGDVITCNQHQLMTRGALRWGGYWCLAGLSVFIPMLHVILVPFFGVLGPLQFYRNINFKYHLPKGEFNCPECQADSEILNSWFGNESRIHCLKCGNQLTLINTN